jgi:hypothetical protein
MCNQYIENNNNNLLTPTSNIQSLTTLFGHPFGHKVHINFLNDFLTIHSTVLCLGQLHEKHGQTFRAYSSASHFLTLLHDGLSFLTPYVFKVHKIQITYNIHCFNLDTSLFPALEPML